MANVGPSSVYQIKKLEKDRINDRGSQPAPPIRAPGAGPTPQAREEFAREQARIADRESRIQHMQRRLLENKGRAREQFRDRSR